MRHSDSRVLFIGNVGLHGTIKEQIAQALNDLLQGIPNGVTMISHDVNALHLGNETLIIVTVLALA
jgi:ABC-type dipeptide/oligopeptide/nickel transport system ATPase component